jgi:hypothetical protein
MKFLLAALFLLGCATAEADTFRIVNGQIYRYSNGIHYRSSLEDYTNTTGMNSYYRRTEYDCRRYYNPYTGQTYGYQCTPRYTYERHNYGHNPVYWDMPVHTWGY